MEVCPNLALLESASRGSPSDTLRYVLCYCESFGTLAVLVTFCDCVMLLPGPRPFPVYFIAPGLPGRRHLSGRLSATDGTAEHIDRAKHVNRDGARRLGQNLGDSEVSPPLRALLLLCFNFSTDITKPSATFHLLNPLLLPSTTHHSRRSRRLHRRLTLTSSPGGKPNPLDQRQRYVFPYLPTRRVFLYPPTPRLTD